MKFKVGIIAGVFLLSTAAAYACHDGAMGGSVLLNQSLMSIDKNSSCRKHCAKKSDGAACPMKHHAEKSEKTCHKDKIKAEKSEGGCCPFSK